MADELNFQLPKEGFDSYLSGILPENQAVLAGAFGVSMQQIKNIDQVNNQQFAKVVYSIETNNGLPLINGTNVPADTFLVDNALSKVALGSGLYGTYTHSDFIGSMTGLPYPLQNIYDGIKQLETSTLTNIYQNLYLAVKWETATVSVQTSYDPGTGLYTVTGISLSSSGGGYGRESSSAPTISLSNGGTGTTTIGTDPNDLSTYGKVLSVTLTSAGSAVGFVPSATVSNPLGPGWPGMNTVVQGYIDAANTEIYAIQTSSNENFQRAKLLNANWNQLGTALKIEQRSRYIALAPVPVPRDKFVAQYPVALYNFVDEMPDIAANTMPHGPAQSLEMLSDQCTVGGQSLIGLMRQERNQQRLAEIGIPLDNNIPSTMSDEDQKQLIANGTKCGATDGIPSDNGLNFTVPAFPITQNCDNQILEPSKGSYFDTNEQSLRKIDQTIPGSIDPLLNNPSCNAIAGPRLPIGPSELLPTGVPDFVNGLTGNVLPFYLNVDFSSNTLLPSQYDVPNAIDNIIECNCDCWVN